MKTEHKTTKLTVVALALAVLVLISLSAGGGSLEPNASPSPTMKTLDEVYNKIQATGSTSPPNWSEMPSYSQVVGSSAIHMELTGQNQGAIEGSCTVQGRENTIVVVGYEHGISIPIDQNGQPSGSRVHSPLSILKYFDKSSPKLYQALVTGEHMTNVMLKFYRISQVGTEEHYFTITLEDAIIVGIKSSFPNVESVSLAYRRIRWTWEPDGIESEDDWTAPPG